jgi:toxin ParE1/3/4
MGREIVLSKRARLDLIEVWQFIADDNETAADRFLGRIDTVLAMLRDNPLAGCRRPELAPEIGSFPVGNFILFYRPIAASVELVRVRRGYLDIQPEDMD